MKFKLLFTSGWASGIILNRNSLLREEWNILESEKLAGKFVEFLQGKKAKEINLIDIRGISVLADYFIICSGTSTTHNKAIADELGQKATEIGAKHMHLEGYDTARWILADYGDIVVHVFHEEDRDFYKLERLWSDGILKTYN